MPDVVLIVAVGTALLLLLGMFITFMTLTYQQKRLVHQQEVNSLMEAYQKELLQAKLEVQEQTLLSISQEIHDNVGQVLSLVRLNISTLPPASYPGNEQKISSAKHLLDQALEDLRDLSKRLNSQYVTRQPLADLLRFQLDMIRKTGAVETSYQVTGEEHSVAPEKKLILFRIVQEALNNALRHAEAANISVQLAFETGCLRLTIGDDGRGLLLHRETNQPLTKGTGTANMNYRAKLIGAELRFHSTTGQGTQVQLQLPLT